MWCGGAYRSGTTKRCSRSCSAAPGCTRSVETFVWGGSYEPRSLIRRNRWVTTSTIVECRETLADPGDSCCCATSKPSRARRRCGWSSTCAPGSAGTRCARSPRQPRPVERDQQRCADVLERPAGSRCMRGRSEPHRAGGARRDLVLELLSARAVRGGCSKRHGSAPAEQPAKVATSSGWSSGISCVRGALRAQPWSSSSAP